MKTFKVQIIKTYKIFYEGIATVSLSDDVSRKEILEAANEAIEYNIYGGWLRGEEELIEVVSEDIQEIK